MSEITLLGDSNPDYLFVSEDDGQETTTNLIFFHKSFAEAFLARHFHGGYSQGGSDNSTDSQGGMEGTTGSQGEHGSTTCTSDVSGVVKICVSVRSNDETTDDTSDFVYVFNSEELDLVDQTNPGNPDSNYYAFSLERGMTYEFDVDAPGHPFTLVNFESMVALDASSGVTNNTTDDGVITFSVAQDFELTGVAYRHQDPSNPSEALHADEGHILISDESVFSSVSATFTVDDVMVVTFDHLPTEVSYVEVYVSDIINFEETDSPDTLQDSTPSSFLVPAQNGNFSEVLGMLSVLNVQSGTVLYYRLIAYDSNDQEIGGISPQFEVVR
jgi:hypothetical protein